MKFLVVSGLIYMEPSTETPDERRKRKQREWNASDRGKASRKATVARYRTTHRGKETNRRTAERYRKRPDGLVKKYKMQAKMRDLCWELDDKCAEALVVQNCNYCNFLPNPVNGIDRKDNSLGYTKDNSVPCCHKCNRAKMDMKYDEWNDWIERLISHQMNLKAYEVVVVALGPERADERRARVVRGGLRVIPEKRQSPPKSEISTCHPPTFQKSQPLTPMTPLPGVRLRSAILRDASAHRSAKSRDFTISAS